MENKGKSRGYLKDPRSAREQETIGGGFFVFRRGDGTGRIRPGNWPFEHATVASATAEACRLASAKPGYQFDIVQVVSSVVESADMCAPEADAVAA